MFLGRMFLFLRHSKLFPYQFLSFQVR
jgi:hypothetical protein